jgi:predicted MarR family transcription regulator
VLARKQNPVAIAAKPNLSAVEYALGKHALATWTIERMFAIEEHDPLANRFRKM